MPFTDQQIDFPVSLDPYNPEQSGYAEEATTDAHLRSTNVVSL